LKFKKQKTIRLLRGGKRRSAGQRRAKNGVLGLAFKGVGIRVDGSGFRVHGSGLV